jgi:Biopolymer transport protein ExbD/TolR
VIATRWSGLVGLLASAVAIVAGLALRGGGGTRSGYVFYDPSDPLSVHPKLSGPLALADLQAPARADIHVAIRLDGIAVDGVDVELGQLGDRLRALGADAATTVRIHADSSVAYTRLVDVMDRVRASGVDDIAIE